MRTIDSEGIREICAIVADKVRDGDVVTLNLMAGGDGCHLGIINAPARVVDEVRAHGYTFDVELGAAFVTRNGAR